MKKNLLEFGLTQLCDWKHISEVKAGKSELMCPWCKRSLIAKKGRIKAHHFSHDGETCRESTRILNQSLLPTFDTFELLDSDERKYIERLEKYRSHKNLYSWPGMRPAIDRLEVMGVIKVTPEAGEQLDQAKLLLDKLEDGWLDNSGSPSDKLLELFAALLPLSDLERFWRQPSKIGQVELTADYRKNKFNSLYSLECFDRAQRFWFDSFLRRQAKFEPNCLPFIVQKIQALNRQSLYVMGVTGSFPLLPEQEFIKIGMTSRNPEERLKEVLRSLKPYGDHIQIEVLMVKKNAGRLERLLHRYFQKHNISIGSFREFFSIQTKDWLLQELNNRVFEKYEPLIFCDMTAQQERSHYENG